MKKAKKEIQPLKLKPSELIILLTVAALVVGFTGFITRRINFYNNLKKLEYNLKNNRFADNSKTFTMNQYNKSGETGKVTLKDVNGKLEVSAFVSNAPKGLAQPMHIHSGTCNNLGSIKYNLSNLKDGSSMTTLDTSLYQLSTQTPLAINVHKSVNLMSINVSCSDLSF